MIRIFTLVLAIVISTATSFGQSLTFVDPNGKRAKDVSFYRSLISEPYRKPRVTEEMRAGGMEDMMEYMMADSVGGMGGISMGGVGASQPPPEVIAFFNGEPLQSLKGKYADEWFITEEDGTLNDSDKPFPLFFTSENPPRHRYPGLAESPSGFAFVPKGTRTSDPIKLRPWHRVSVFLPEGLDPSEFQVLACWRNGFAYPSFDFYAESLHEKRVGKEFDLTDWKFKPQFMWFVSANISNELRLPPGEVRITIVPKKSLDQQAGAEISLTRLEELLIAGGPSQLMTLSGKQSNSKITFEPSAQLIVELPKASPSVLPDWGDDHSFRYRLECIAQDMGGALDMSPIVHPAVQDLADGPSFVGFLNASRPERSDFQPYRLPTEQTSKSLRFDGLGTGWYVLQRSVSGGPWKTDVSFKGFAAGKGVFSTRVEEGASRRKDAAIRFSISTDGKISMQVPDAAGSISNPAVPAPRTTAVDADRLEQIRVLRSDIEQTIRRLLAHRKRLVEMELKLGGQSNQSNKSDPFGGPDPFGDANRTALPEESGGIF